MIEQMADLLETNTRRALALKVLLVRRELITDDELAALMTAMDEETTLGVEFSDKPEHVEWRRLRRAAQQLGDEQDQEPDKET
jgi:hypothetical protein